MAMFLNDDDVEEEVFSSEGKKDVLRHYLKETGIIDKLSEIFKKMLNASEKPDNPIDFIRVELGAAPIPADHIEDMEHQLDGAQREIRRLRSILSDLGVDEDADDCIIIQANPNGDQAGANVDACANANADVDVDGYSTDDSALNNAERGV